MHIETNLPFYVCLPPWRGHGPIQLAESSCLVDDAGAVVAAVDVSGEVDLLAIVSFGSSEDRMSEQWWLGGAACLERCEEVVLEDGESCKLVPGYTKIRARENTLLAFL